MSNFGRSEITVSPIEILASAVGYRMAPVTIAKDVLAAAPLLAGTLLGKITASGKYGAYKNTNVDGTETAVCILGENVYYDTEDKLASAYYSGVFVESKLIGLDAGAKVDLGSATNERGELSFQK